MESTLQNIKLQICLIPRAPVAKFCVMQFSRDLLRANLSRGHAHLSLHVDVRRGAMATLEGTQMKMSSKNLRLVKSKVKLQSILKLAGATKDTFTLDEVMFYLGQYIIKKQLYDPNEQHIVICGQDSLGEVLGLDTFSLKEPIALFSALRNNLVDVKNLGPSQSTEAADLVGNSEEDEPKPRSDSFDESLSEGAIGGLGGGQDGHSSRSSENIGTSERSESDSDPESDPDTDNFSVEFEVESINANDEDDGSVSGDDQLSSSVSQDTLPSVSQATVSEADAVPDLERQESGSLLAESQLPHSFLDPCFVCQERPKNGCIVHNGTGHIMTCYECALKLKKANQWCPVCRMHIKTVIQIYVS